MRQSTAIQKVSSADNDSRHCWTEGTQCVPSVAMEASQHHSEGRILRAPKSKYFEDSVSALPMAFVLNFVLFKL